MYEEENILWSGTLYVHHQFFVITENSVKICKGNADFVSQEWI